MEVIYENSLILFYILTHSKGGTVMSGIIQAALFILSIVGVVILYQKALETEPFLFLKLFGYTVLGAFMLDLNGLKLPLGFAVFLLFFRNISVNAFIKKQAAYIGLVVFLSSLIIPFIETKFYELPRKIELQDTNFYSGSLVEELSSIKEEFKMEHYGVQLTDFRTVITKDGQYKILELSFVEDEYPNQNHYTINLMENGRTLEVKRRKAEHQYWEGMSYTDAHFLLSNIDLITKSMLSHPEMKYYALRTDGQRMGYEIRDQDKFSIHTGGKEKVENNELPVEGILVDVCGTNGEIDQYGSMFQCDIHEHYLLDMLKREVDINRSTILSEARKKSLEIDQWLNEHIGDHIGFERNGEYVLKQDGVEKKVTENEYFKALKETPITAITFDETKNIWQVSVENPYGNGPHFMEFTLDGVTREIIRLIFR
jgi:hypothetical protein